MSLAWYFHRLRNMSPGEIAHRVVEKRRKMVSRNRHEGWERFTDGILTIPVLPGLREPVLHAALGAREAIDRVSIDLLDGRFAALGCDWPKRDPGNLFPAGLWTLDPITGSHWPSDGYCFDISYRHEAGRGDIKYVWELNRLQFLQPLAARVLLADDEAALKAIEDCIESWHLANPPFRGTVWNSGIELALRAISLLVVTSLCGPRLSPATVSRVRQILAAHAFWMARFPSRFSSANNHLIAEAAGEYLVALAMPDMVDASRLGAKAKALLHSEVTKQIHPDGVPAEQSPTYGAFSLEFALLCLQVGRASGEALNETVRDRFLAFSRFIAAISDGEGRTPAFCDDDEGRVIWTGAESHYPASIANAGLAFLGEPGPVGLPYPSLRSAIFGESAFDLTKPAQTQSFPEGGYTVLRHAARGRGAKLVMDHAPLGYLAIAAHGHADALSFTLDIEGRPVLVDPGTYLYHSGGAWRDWFRSTRAHNTLSVDGADQSIMSGAFNWSHKAAAKVARIDEVGIVASHDGYSKRLGITHRREIRRSEDGFILIDTLEGAATGVPVEIVFQLAPSLRADLRGSTASISSNGEKLLDVDLAPGMTTISCGEPDMDGGWVSPAFGRRVPAVRISFETTWQREPIITALRLKS